MTPEADREELRALVEQLLKDGGSTQEATRLLHERAEADPKVLRTVVNGHLHTLCGQVVGRFVRTSNRSTIASAGIQRSSDVTAWAAAVEEGMMNTFRLPGGKLLGDCTRPDLLAGANAYDLLVGDMLVKREWLKLLASRMKDDRATVRSALTEKLVQEARAEARNNPRKAA